MLVTNLCAFFLSESLGRRTILVSGIFALTIFLLIIGIMGCIEAKGAIWVILVCIFLWYDLDKRYDKDENADLSRAIAFQLSTGACGFVLASEVSSLPLRSSAQSIVFTTQLFFGWLIGFVSPYMINPDAGNLGAKVGFVFAGMGVPLCVLFYFFIPETKGLSMVEIDYLFDVKTSCRQFQSSVRSRRADSGFTPDIETRTEAADKGQTSVGTNSVENGSGESRM